MMLSPAPPAHWPDKVEAPRKAGTPLTEPHAAKRREPLSSLASAAQTPTETDDSTASPSDSTNSTFELSRVAESPGRGARTLSVGSDPRTPNEKGSIFDSKSLFDVRVMGVEAEGPIRWYRIRLVCRTRSNFSWEVTRRFSQFDALKKGLAEQGASRIPPLPRKLPQFLITLTEEQRRVLGLQKYCEGLLANPGMLREGAVAEFFDLAFGLWHVTSSMPLRLDRAQERAAIMIQTQMRRFQAAHRQEVKDSSSTIRRRVFARKTTRKVLQPLVNVNQKTNDGQSIRRWHSSFS